MNLRPGSGVFSEVMRVAGVALPYHGLVDLIDKFVEAGIVILGKFKYSV